MRAKQKAEITALSDISRNALSSGLTKLCFWVASNPLVGTPMGASQWAAKGIVSFGGSAATFALLANKTLHSKKFQ